MTTRIKNVAFLIILMVSVFAHSQTKGMFSKDPIIHLENFQKKPIYYGYFLGFSNYDFKIRYRNPGTEIQIKNNLGFNVGIVADIRLQEHLSLRFEPGLYYAKRDLYFPGFSEQNDILREVQSTNIHFPLLLKILSKRTGNVRPYLTTGLSGTLNLNSNSKAREDNYQGIFRVKNWTANYEIGFGIDIFSEYFIFSPSIRGVFGISNELIRDFNASNSAWTGNIESMRTRAVMINFTFH
jgi:hypothetical protein